MRERIKVLYKRLARALCDLKVMGTITSVKTCDAIAALTFDDGPHPEYTPRLLDILERYQARATFFMIGEAARRHPELVRRVAEGGHEIGNHSWDHAPFPSLTGRQRREQIRACHNSIAPYGQRLFRPPYGHQNVVSHLHLIWLHYRVVCWNLHVEDWLDHNANLMAGQLVSRLRPGSIVLLHDALWQPRLKHAANRSPMLEAINMSLDRLCDRFRFITITELLRNGHPLQRSWIMEGDIQ